MSRRHSNVRANVQRMIRDHLGGLAYAGDPASGCLDIVACVDGVYFEIDVKLPPDTLSARQVARVEAVRAAGGHALTVVNSADAVDQVAACLYGGEV